jgi:hypothetical protein
MRARIAWLRAELRAWNPVVWYLVAYVPLAVAGMIVSVVAR